MADEYTLIPELGDLITLVSDVYGTTTGRIIYRDGSLIRVKPTHESTRAMNFPLDAETGLFREALGVTELTMHEKARDFHFSKQLAVLPGEMLEFYTSDGQPAGESGIVAQVIATDSEDAIQLEDGRTINFGFLGPPAPIEIVLPRTVVEEGNVEEASNADVEDTTTTTTTEEVFPEIDYAMLPAALVEEIPTSERNYSDGVQREDMFVSLLMDIPAAKQKNPRVLRNLYRKTDLLLALKNSIVVRDETGGVVAGEQRSYEAATLREALDKQPVPAPLSAVLPVAAVKKVLYADLADATPLVYDDVEIRPDTFTLMLTQATNTRYRDFRGGDEAGNPFVTYMDTLLRQNLPSFVPATSGGPAIVTDQDVIRTRVPPDPVQAFPADLPPAVATRRGEDEVVFGPEFLATAAPSVVRLLSASVLRDPRTGLQTQIAPADTAATVGHILLSPALESFRAPTRSSVLLWDIQASETSRARTQVFYRALMDTWELQRVLADDSAVSLAAEVGERLPTTITQLANRSVLQTLDSMGLRNLEINGEIMDVLRGALKRGTTAWDEEMRVFREHVVSVLAQSNEGPVFDIAEEGLWNEGITANRWIKLALENIQTREVNLATTGLARAAYMSAKANGTLRELWFAAAAATGTEEAEATYAAERRRLERAQFNRRAAEKALTAAPTINKCTHVYLLETIRSIRDDKQRMRLLEDFITKYQAGQRGNWLICGTCDQHLVCRHELLLLHEFQHPGRSVAMHKSLILEFGGPVFEGAYICKSCGQRIADLEYDSHMEFDDDGKPLVGRTVVESEEGEDELDLAVPLADAAQQTYGFTGDDLKHFYVVRTALESCGIAPTEELYTRMVSALRDFMADAKRIPPAKVYEVMRADKKRRLPAYEAFLADITLGVIGALIVLELQTQDLAVPFPAHGCVFSRAGFPLAADGEGALTYASCVLAGVLRNSAPWNVASWSAETSIPKRKAVVLAAVKQNLVGLLCIPGPSGKALPPLTTVTDYYQTALEARRNRDVAGSSEDVDVQTLPSARDTVPLQFRPIPYVGKGAAAAAATNTTAIQNAKQFARDTTEGAVGELTTYICARQPALFQQAIAAIHDTARASARELHVLSEMSPRSDANCCYRRLGAVAIQGLGYVAAAELGAGEIAEVVVLSEGAETVKHRDPVRSANGTHLYSPWSAPYIETLQPQADATIYYRLFLKHCFRGANMGAIHEFGATGVCRHCDFTVPAEFTFLTVSEIADSEGRRLEKRLDEMATERQRLALAAFEAQGVVIDERTFHELEDAIHRRRMLAPQPVPTVLPLLSVLEMLDVTGGPLLSSAAEDWRVLQGAMSTIHSRGLPDGPERRRLISGFAKRYDDMLAAVEMRMGELLGSRPTVASRATLEAAIRGLIGITEDSVGAASARNLLAALVVPAEQIARGYRNEKPPVAKWFPKVSRSHKDLLFRIWERQGAVVDRGLKTLELMSDERDIPIIEGTMERIAAWLGPWLSTWISNIRPDVRSLTAAECQLVLRWLVLHVVAAVLTDESAVYREVTTETRRRVITFMQGWLVDALRTAGSQVAEFQMSAEQIQEALLARAEMEKASFIQKFDKLDREMRKLEMIKKKLKLGDWSVGTVKNLFNYDADFFEFERGQRAAMGLPDFAGDITGATGAEGAAENPYGFMEFGEQTTQDRAYDHRARHDEDE